MSIAAVRFSTRVEEEQISVGTVNGLMRGVANRILKTSFANSIGKVKKADVLTVRNLSPTYA